VGRGYFKVRHIQICTFKKKSSSFFKPEKPKITAFSSFSSSISAKDPFPSFPNPAGHHVLLK